MTHAELDRIIKSAAHYYRVRVPYADEDDLRQRAWISILEAMPSYDPAVGPLAAFVGGVAHRAMQRELQKHSGFIRRPENLRENLSYTGDGDLVARDPGPEMLVDRRRLANTVLDIVTATVLADPPCALGIEVVLGVAAPAEIAAERKIDVARVYRATQRLRRALEADGRLARLSEVC